MLNAIDRFTGIALAKWSPVFGLTLSIGIGTGLYILTDNAIEKDANERFGVMVRNAQSALNGRIKGYADVLRGTASLFQTTPTVTREQFHSYVKGLELQTEFPGIETVNFAKYFTAAERPAFEALMHKELADWIKNGPAFRIFPDGHRNEYTVLTYIEPKEPWSNRYGMDLHARPTVALTLSDSRDTGQPSTSGTRVPLNSTASGLAMRMPVYRPGLPLDTVEQRRAAYVGSVGIGFGVERLVQGIIEHLPSGTHLVISGMSPDEQPNGPRGNYRRMVFFDNMRGKKPSSMPYFEMTLPIGISERGWLATFRIPKASLHSDVDFSLPWIALFAGWIGSFMLYALYQTLSTSRLRAVSLAKEMTQELRASESRLQQTNELLRRLAAHAETIKESERKRIAREIHDELGQNLLALRIEVDLLASRTTGGRHPRLHARVEWTLDQIDAAIKSVRQIINDLRPNVLDLGLNAAVDWQIIEFRRRTGITCELIQNNDDVHISDHCATALFRILQESLTNITRHARASHVRVELVSRPDRISMSVTDNGVGIHPAVRYKSGSFGLVGVEERIKILGGFFEIRNAPRGGTVVHVSIPVDTPSPSPGQFLAPEDMGHHARHVTV